MATKCPKCQTENPDDSKFCKECASPLKHPGDVSVTKTIKTPAKGISKGTIIAGKYQILQKLGEGGMGIVYKAKDSGLDRTVALKFLSSDLIKDKEARKRFIQEAKAAAALEHPNICTVYEVNEADDQTFIAMSYIDRQSLKDKLREGPLGVDEAKDIAIQVAEGLKEAHEKGIVHRDIKPANIMLTKKGQAKITDFGLAKLSWGVGLTKTSTIMGTVAYMSPEQARGEEVDNRTDVCSLGAMLYEMLSCERPFQKAQEDPWACMGQLYQHALQGEKHKAAILVTEAIKSAVQWDETESWYLAGVYALIDERETSMDWLENAVKRGFLNYPCLNEYDPFLENIRSEPRFKKLMERVKHEWENFEV